MEKKIEKSVLKLIGKAISVEVKKSEREGLPICPVILHQPKRPIKKSTELEKR